jgi:predicted DNA-binding transcriptional regulator YafY
MIGRVQPLERLLNLLTLLLESERPVTFDRIRELIPAYQHGDVASAKRMFERDKDDLREAGVPLELTFTDAWEVEQGYAIAKDRYYLPELTFTAEELAALFVAASSGDDTEPAGSAVQKLSVGAGPGILGRLSDAPLVAAIDPAGGHLRAVATALGRGRAISFSYRRADGEAEDRTVDPYGLVFRAGNWYLVGHDRAREAVRAFRISRITSAPKEDGDAALAPEGFRAAEHVQTPGEAASGSVRVALSEKVAWWALSSMPGARRLGSEDGWVQAEIPVAGRDALVAWLAGFGPDAHLLDEGPVRDALVSHLETVVEAL